MSEQTNETPNLKSTKAWVGGALSGIIAFGSSLQTALQDNSITSSEWTGAILAGLIAFGAVTGLVWRVPNNPK